MCTPDTQLYKIARCTSRKKQRHRKAFGINLLRYIYTRAIVSNILEATFSVPFNHFLLVSQRSILDLATRIISPLLQGTERPPVRYPRTAQYPNPATNQVPTRGSLQPFENAVEHPIVLDEILLWQQGEEGP